MKFRSKFSILFSFVLIFSIFAAVSLFLLSFGILASNNGQETKLQEYQYREINPHNGELTNGFVQLPITLEREGYVSYLNEKTGSSIIITNFGGSNFECFGTCYCDDSEIRRLSSTTSQVLGRGLAILVSAFSVSMATKIARDTFQDQCVQQYSPACRSETIHSEVENCEEGEEEESTENESEISTKNEDGKAYLCKGYCINSLDYFENTPEQAKEEFMYVVQELGQKKYGLCESFTLEKEVEVSAFDFPDEQIKSELSAAMLKFGQGLHTYCNENTMIRHEDFPQHQQQETLNFIKTMKDICENDDHPLVEAFGKEKIKSMLEDSYKMRDQGTSYCHGVRVVLDSESMRMDAGGGNIKCVKRSEKNPKWDSGWDDLSPKTDMN